MINITKTREIHIHLYEVIRVIDNIPLFLEDHLERLYHSARLYNIHNLPESEILEGKISELVSEKKMDKGNIKLSFIIKDQDRLPVPELEFISHYYPPPEKYTTGVKVGILKAERPNPQAKIQHTDIRKKANLMISREHVFEVILVDNDNNITEGSRSNVFFTKKNKVFSPPDEKILQGITRKKVLQICERNRIPVIKTDIPLEKINSYEGAFLTGSSPKVLPISAIGDFQFTADLPLIRDLINFYDQEITEYINRKSPRQL